MCECLSYLENGLIVHVVENSPVDLTGLQGDPVQHRHPELGLDRLLYLHRCQEKREIHRYYHGGDGGEDDDDEEHLQKSLSGPSVSTTKRKSELEESELEREILIGR